MPVVTAFYAALIALLAVVLSMQVIRQRRHKRIGIGAGGDEAMERATRVFGNFAEYAALFVVLMALAELLGTTRPWLHIYGMLFVLGRMAHAVGLSRTSGASAGRFAGIFVTIFVLVGLAIALLIASIPRIF
jgi:uncharacterized membrane protein YecN with MAPEG domain